jgi:hypothetical protein
MQKEVSMGTKIGLWIDHKKAVIVSISDKREEIKQVISKVEKQIRRSGDSPLKGPFDSYQVPPENKRQNAFTRHLNIYYDAVIAAIRDAEAIFISGPGEAKVELKKRLLKKNFAGQVKGVETADKITDRQFAIKVRKLFTE